MTTRVPTTNTTCTLLSLPSELRLEIYTHLFHSTSCAIQIYQHNIQLLRSYSQCPGGPLPLLLSCKTICNELQDLLYNLTTFHIQLHVQHLPLLRQQQKLLSAGPSSFAPGYNFENKARYGFSPVWNLPMGVKKFFREIRRHVHVSAASEPPRCTNAASSLHLDIWLTSAARSDEMAKQIGAFKDALGADAEGEGSQRIFKELRIRFKLKPIGFLQECERMTRGKADIMVNEVSALRCRTKREIMVEDEVGELLSQKCLDNVRQSF